MYAENRALPGGRGAVGTAAGFTLVELLVVISIVSLLASMLLPSLEKAKERAHDAESMNNVRSIMVAITMYHNDWEKYPPGDVDTPDASYRKLPLQLTQQMEITRELVAPGDGGFIDGMRGPIFYWPSELYPKSTRIVGPPISGSYNPTTYQLFSFGNDGKMGVTGTAQANQDNIWADPKNDRVVVFRNVRNQPGQ